MAPSLFSFIVLITLFSTLALSHDLKHHHIATKNHLKSLKFTLYLHETINKTAYFVVKGVAGPTGITKTSNSFGSLVVYQDPLTETPDPTSKVLGHVEGLATTSSFTGERTTCVSRMTLNIKGYKGELLNVETGYYNQVSELPFVGGTGDFRFAQGYIISTLFDLRGEGACYKTDFVIYWPPYAHLAN
ncbi:hypothetical protein RND81_09G032700 [Saponaria officinalis]|uniref:Dirigent protein n=1 Tax=Saponaria officinalis TaxID=3572 RepID=A0AAW1IHD2_SAPOF